MRIIDLPYRTVLRIIRNTIKKDKHNAWYKVRLNKYHLICPSPTPRKNNHNTNTNGNK